MNVKAQPEDKIQATPLSRNYGPVVDQALKDQMAKLYKETK